MPGGSLADLCVCVCVQVCVTQVFVDNVCSTHDESNYTTLFVVLSQHLTNLAEKYNAMLTLLIWTRLLIKVIAKLYQQLTHKKGQLLYKGITLRHALRVAVSF